MADESQQLIDAFSNITGTAVTRDVVFGSRTLRVEGICDGSEGVQRNAWVEWEGDKQMAYAGVNLEGSQSSQELIGCQNGCQTAQQLEGR